MEKESRESPRALPFSYGIAWLMKSLALLRQQSGRLLLIAVVMQVILGLTQLPLVGFLIILSVPALSAGILEAFHVTRLGGFPGVNLLFRPLLSGSHTGRLLLTGALVFALGIISMSLVLSGSEDLLDPELMSRIEQGDMEAISQLDPAVVGRMALAFAIGVSVSGTLSYFTIPLIWFGNRTLGAALVQGLRALIVNWKPFVMLVLGLFVVLIPVAVISALLFNWAGAGGVVSLLVMACIMLLLLAFQMLLFGTQYCSFQDIFMLEDRPEPPTEEDDGQFVA